jgi:L-threonylcarbamoyladenylate synthase
MCDSLTLSPALVKQRGMNRSVPDVAEIARMAALLRGGDIVAFPTETVYGLGADATSSDAVLKIYEAKGRPRFNPLIVHVPDIEGVERLVDLPPLARRLAARFWPGPLTLVLPKRGDAGLSDIVTAGLETVGIRVPDHPVARALLREAGVPVAAPSANPSGQLSPTTAAQVLEGFGGRIPVLDGGQCRSGVESTILTFDGERLIQLRPGAISREQIEGALGLEVSVADPGGPISAPGMLASHYAPRAALRLNVRDPEPDELVLGFGAGDGFDLNLSLSGELREAARNLFTMLHDLDRKGIRIAVVPIPEHGLGEAINDRLRRAAAPRG